MGTSAGPCSRRRKAVWGMPSDMLKSLPGYDPDVQKNRTEARDIMEKLGYGPAKRLEVKVSERNIAIFRDPAVILIDQLKEIYIDGELDPIETANWFPKFTARITRSASISLGSALTTPMRNSMRIMRAARSVITPGIAIPSCKKCSSSNLWRRTRGGVSGWC